MSDVVGFAASRGEQDGVISFQNYFTCAMPAGTEVEDDTVVTTEMSGSERRAGVAKSQ